MNFRKFRKNTKALSPVVASIILIAVTVAVSIAVAAWMGGLSIGFMQTEQVSLGIPVFTAAVSPATGKITIDVTNTGTSTLTLSSVSINNVAATGVTLPATLAANAKVTLTITPGTSTPITLGNNYQIKVVTSKNNAFTTSAIAV